MTDLAEARRRRHSSVLYQVAGSMVGGVELDTSLHHEEDPVLIEETPLVDPRKNKNHYEAISVSGGLESDDDAIKMTKTTASNLCASIFSQVPAVCLVFLFHLMIGECS